mgnify:CR=1 FL=1
MISFEYLELITIIKGKQYRVVIDGTFDTVLSCEDCALKGLKECDKNQCSSVKHDLQYHYEEIPK